MIFTMNVLKMLFAWIVSIVFLFIKKLGAQQNSNKRRIAIYKQKLSLPGDIIIYAPEENLEMK